MPITIVCDCLGATARARRTDRSPSSRICTSYFPGATKSNSGVLPTNRWFRNIEAPLGTDRKSTLPAFFRALSSNFFRFTSSAGGPEGTVREAEAPCREELRAFEERDAGALDVDVWADTPEFPIEADASPAVCPERPAAVAAKAIISSTALAISIRPPSAEVNFITNAVRNGSPR